MKTHRPNPPYPVVWQHRASAFLLMNTSGIGDGAAEEAKKKNTHRKTRPAQRTGPSTATGSCWRRRTRWPCRSWPT